MLDLGLHALTWDLTPISTRTTELAGVGPVSGHNGEILGVLAGALGSFVQHGDAEYAQKAADVISPAVNDPGTAFRCVDQLSSILIRFAEHPAHPAV